MSRGKHGDGLPPAPLEPPRLHRHLPWDHSHSMTYPACPQSGLVFQADLHIRSRLSRDSSKICDIEQRQTLIPTDPADRVHHLIYAPALASADLITEVLISYAARRTGQGETAPAGASPFLRVIGLVLAADGRRA